MNNIDIISMLIDADPMLLRKRTDDDYTPLHIAIQSGSYEAMVRLIELGANVFDCVFNDNTTPLALSCLDIACESEDCRMSDYLEEIQRKNSSDNDEALEINSSDDEDTESLSHRFRGQVLNDPHNFSSHSPPISRIYAFSEDGH